MLILARRLAGTVEQFKTSCDATAALEFAVVSPFLLAAFAGLFEVSREVDATRRVTTYADAAASMLAATPAAGQGATAATVGYLDLHYANDAAMLIFPGVLSDSYAKGINWNTDISISMAGISFTPNPSSCQSNCTYTANVVWTGAAAQRACGSTPISVKDVSFPSPGTLPVDLFNPITTPTGQAPPRFAIVVDVVYTWAPLIFSRFFGTMTIKRSAYISPRYVNQITYAKGQGDDGFGKECPGF